MSSLEVEFKRTDQAMLLNTITWSALRSCISLKSRAWRRRAQKSTCSWCMGPEELKVKPWLPGLRQLNMECLYWVLGCLLLAARLPLDSAKREFLCFSASTFSQLSGCWPKWWVMVSSELSRETCRALPSSANSEHAQIIAKCLQFHALLGAPGK